MEEKKVLTEKQKQFIQFCIELGADGVKQYKTKAYQKAYNITDEGKEYARVNATRLFQNATIANAIEDGIAEKRKRREKLREKAEEKAIIKEVLTKEGAKLILTEIAQGHAPLNIGGKIVLENKRDRIAAIVELSKMEGWQENDGGSQGNITINITSGTANGNKIEKYDSEPDDD